MQFKYVYCEISHSPCSSWSKQRVCVFQPKLRPVEYSPFTEAGYKALFLSVNVPVLGHQLNEYCNNFQIPADMSYCNIFSVSSDKSLHTDYSSSPCNSLMFMV